MTFAVLRAVAMALCAKWCRSDFVQTGSVADASPVSKYAWQRQPPGVFYLTVVPGAGHKTA